MAKINLLPWREEQRKLKQQEFAFMSGGAAVIAGLIVLLAHLHVDGMISNQDTRNTFIESEIEILDERIGRIKELEKLKADLLARMNVIQELQHSRPQSVHLMDEMVRTLPDGVYLNKFVQKDKELSMNGIAQSNARVSDYMRNIDSSDWLADPSLDQIKTTEENRRRLANFQLQGKQKVLKQHAGDVAPDEEGS